MFGKNPKRPAINGEVDALDVQEIFATIQGEGPNAGTPAVFVRLGGCNLACSFCDTEFESYSAIKIDEIIQEIKEKSLNKNNIRTHNLVVITGGEPMRQPIEEFCKKLLEEKFSVQIETNGTIFRDLDSRVQIICSPKNISKYSRIREDLLPKITAFKFLISAFDEKYYSVQEIGQADYNIPVYVQPIDDYNEQKNQANLLKTIEIARENNYKISLQIHKYMNIP
ncbi:MAG: 7-carboxy-7-deazaguanine synthase QueE [Rickettsiales bacterium]|nr:7-carboxy-7-deazaguanine synthase QueE [Rickettsiales bacterium]